MKLLVGADVGNYSFSPSTRQITLNNMGGMLTLNNFLVITNVTDNVIIYNFMNPSLGATALSNNVITLAYNTTSMSSTDSLQIYVDVSFADSMETLLRRMNKLLESNAIVDSSGRQRIAIEAGSIVVTATTALGISLSGNDSGANPYTIASVRTLYTTEGPVDQRWRIINDCRQSYALGVRKQLIWDS